MAKTRNLPDPQQQPKPKRKQKNAAQQQQQQSKRVKKNQLRAPGELAAANVPPEDDASTKHWWSRFVGTENPQYQAYMRDEWGFAQRGENELFEKLCLEGAQSGLSWALILSKREAYRSAFHGFNVQKCAAMTEDDVEEIMSSEGTGGAVVVKNRSKVASVPHNARCVLKLQQTHGASALSDLLWSFVGGSPQLNHWKISEVPSKTKESEAMSKALKKLDFKYVGPTTCYSLMQACGLVIDHPYNTPEWEAARKRLNLPTSNPKS